MPDIQVDPTDRTEGLSAVEDWVERIAGGDPSAERELCRRFYPSALLIARRHCRNLGVEPRDVVQEVFATLLERLRRRELRDPRALPDYLRQCIQNCCRNSARTTGRISNDVEPERQDPQAGPLQIVLREEGRALLLNLMRALPQARDRELLVRFFAQSQDRDQICAELGIEPAHFRRVLSRARARMRELLSHSGESDAL